MVYTYLWLGGGSVRYRVSDPPPLWAPPWYRSDCIVIIRATPPTVLGPTKVTKPTPPTMLSLSSSWLRWVGSFRGHFHHSCPVRQGMYHYIKDITPHLMTTRNIRQRHGSVFQFNICSPHPPPSCFSPKFFLPPRFIDGAAPSSSFWGEESSNGQCGSLGNLQTIGSQPPAPYYFYQVFGYHRWYRPGPQEIQICYIGLQVLLLLPVVCQPTKLQDIAVDRIGISWPHSADFSESVLTCLDIFVGWNKLVWGNPSHT